MPALNRVQLIGYLGRDPQTRITSTGKKVCSFTLAVHRFGRPEPDWFQIQAWGRLGEVCQQYLAKGSLIFAEGHLHTERRSDEKGEAQYRAYVIMRQMQMLDRKPGEQDVAAEAEPDEQPVTA